MSIKKLNLNLGANDSTKSTFNNFAYFSKWARAIKSGLSTIENEWNRLFIPFFSDLPDDQEIDPWVHGLDGKTLYGDADAATSNQEYSNTTRPYTLKEIIDRVYTTLYTHSNDIQALKKRAENLLRYVTTDEGGGGSGSSGYPPGYINGLGLTYNDASNIDVGVGYCRDSTNTTDIPLAAGVTVNLASSGALGLDTGSEASSTWYYVHVIYDSTNEVTSALFSLSDTSPTLPGTYDKFRRIGSVRNDGSSNILEFEQSSEGVQRRYLWAADLVGQQNTRILNNGTSSSFVQCSYNPGSGTRYSYHYVPPTACLQHVRFINNLGAGGCQLRIKGETYGSILLGDYQEVHTQIAIGIDQDLEYKATSGGSAYVEMFGYTESL